MKLGGVAAAVGAALSAVIIPAAQLEDKLRDALILTGETGKEFDALNIGMTNAAKDLSDKLGVSAEDVAVGFYQVLSTGAEAMSEQFDAVAETSIKFAKTIGLPVSQAVEKINNTLKAFQMEGTKAEHVADVFFTATKLASFTVPELTDAMRDAAPVAAKFGITIEETSAILAKMADAGEKGARAGTAFKMIMIKLGKPTKEANKWLKKMEVTIFKAGKMRKILDIFQDMKTGLKKLTQQQSIAALKAIAGEEAFAKLAGVLGSNIDEAKEWAKTMEDTGVINLAFNQRQATTIRRLDKLKFALKNLAAEGGMPFLDTLSDMADSLANFTKAIREFLNKYPAFILALLEIAKVSGLGLILGGAAPMRRLVREPTQKVVNRVKEFFGGDQINSELIRGGPRFSPAGQPSGARGPNLGGNVTNNFNISSTVNAETNSSAEDISDAVQKGFTDKFDNEKRNALKVVEPGAI